jgi:hypothetical protein
MPSALKKIERRKNAVNKLDHLSSKEDRTLIIHYSCESFYDREDGQTPRITSIALRNFSSASTASFSIHKVAEQKQVRFGDIEANYNELEKEMLDEFFRFVDQNRTCEWVHWNMRDINYGFPAIEHRYKVLGGDPIVIDESRKHDLSRLLIELYGNNYIGHKRLTKLMAKNDITPFDFLEGQGEADAFENKEYVKLHQSTLRKVDVLAGILGRTMDGSLKTDASWWDQYGVHPIAALEYIAKHWVFTLVVGVLGVLGVTATSFFSQRMPSSPKPNQGLIAPTPEVKPSTPTKRDAIRPVQ